jgi:hypothetical protein
MGNGDREQQAAALRVGNSMTNTSQEFSAALRATLEARGFGRSGRGKLPEDPSRWTDAELLGHLAGKFLSPDLAHLDPRLAGARVGSTVTCGGADWIVTDIGTRTFSAVKVEPERDASWLSGPPYSVAETVFDECDIPAVTMPGENIREA